MWNTQKIKKIVIGLWIGIFLWTVPAWSMDAILAVVNDEVITLQDLKSYIKQTYVSLVADGVDPKKIEKIMADLEINGIKKLIEDRLILSRANEVGLEVRDKLIDQRVDEITKRYGNEQEFLKALIEHGGTITDLRKKIENQLKITYVIDFEIKSKIYVNPQEVTDYYEKNIDQFQQKESVILKSIFISKGENASASRSRAQGAMKKIQAGDVFDEIANQYSESPSIGRIERGQIMPAVEKVVFNLETGEVSSIVETETGYYIMKLEEKISAQLAPLSDVKDKVSDLIYKTKFRDHLEKWLDNLKKEAYVEIKN